LSTSWANGLLKLTPLRSHLVSKGMPWRSGRQIRFYSLDLPGHNRASEAVHHSPRLLAAETMFRPQESRPTSKGFWKRRNLLIGLAIVALSIGIVFASIPFLPSPPIPHSSIGSTSTTGVKGGSQYRPGFYALKISGLSANQNFWVGVKVTNGTASFCVMPYQPYYNWVQSYNTSSYSPLTQTSCTGLGPTPQETQDTLKFAPSSSGTWVVVALNVSSTPITVDFLPA
jgi:hypothetical protein